MDYTDKDKPYRKRKSKLKTLEKILYDKAIVKVSLIYIVSILFIGIAPSIVPPDVTGGVSLTLIVSILISLYIIGFMIHFLKGTFSRLHTASSLSGLIISYFALLFVVALLLSSVYAMTERYKIGYLTYGQCSSEFSPEMVDNDPLLSDEYFYFTAVTLFGLGYGDICPMGWNKEISLVNSFVGNIIFVIVMVLVVSAFLRREQRKRKTRMNDNIVKEEGSYYYRKKDSEGE